MHNEQCILDTLTSVSLCSTQDVTSMGVHDMAVCVGDSDLEWGDSLQVVCSCKSCNNASPEQACVGVGAAAHDLIGLLLIAQAIAYMVK